MARETAQQRKDRLALEEARREADERAEWYPRLVKAMARAHKLGFRLAAGDGLLSYTNPHDRGARPTVLNTEYSQEAQRALEHLEFELNWQEEQFAEAERKAKARKDALAKLTDEDKELLGLK